MNTMKKDDTKDLPKYVENVVVFNSSNVTIKGISFQSGSPGLASATVIDLFTSTVFIVVTVINAGGLFEPIAESDGSG